MADTLSAAQQITLVALIAAHLCVFSFIAGCRYALRLVAQAEGRAGE
jgi:hypothetical protein